MQRDQDWPREAPDVFDRGAPADQFFEADALQAMRNLEEVMDFAEHLVGPP